MSFICCICQDSLTERPQVLSDNDDELHLCTLKCGHLFHRVCVQQWFNGNSTSGSSEGTCPSCKIFTSLSQALRIFPTGDEDSNEIAEQNKTLHSLITDNQKLESELREVKNELDNLQLSCVSENQKLQSDLKTAMETLASLQSRFEEENQKLELEVRVAKEELSSLQSLYEDESVAHEVLKIEYGTLLSTMEAQKEELKDNGELEMALENSVKTALERVEKEKKAAMLLLGKFESKNKALLQEMEALVQRGRKDQELFFEATTVHGLNPMDPCCSTSIRSENIDSLIENLCLLQEHEDA